MSDDLKTRIKLYRQHNARTARYEAVLPDESVGHGDRTEFDHQAVYTQPEESNNAANGRESNILRMAQSIELNNALNARRNQQSQGTEYTAEDIRILQSKLDRTKSELGQLRNRVDLLILLIAVIVFAVSVLPNSSLS